MDEDGFLTSVGNAFHELHSVKLFPSVGMKKQPRVHLKANFGQEPFVFDIDGMVKVCIFRLFFSFSLLTVS